MLGPSLAAVVLLMLAAHLVAWTVPPVVRPRHVLLPLVAVVVGTVGLNHAAGSGMIHGHVVILGFFLAVALAGWLTVRQQVRWFFPFSGTALLLVIVFVGLLAWEQYKEIAARKAEFPFESMTGRAPEPRPGTAPTGPAADRLARLWRDSDSLRYSGYSAELAKIHRAEVELFVKRPGEGVGRFGAPAQPYRRPPIITPDGQFISSGDPLAVRGRPPAQPEPPGPTWTESDTFEPAHPDRPRFDEMHLNGVLDFAYPRGWGLIWGRQAAGFRPHTFSRVPDAKEWRVTSVLLIGLVKHPEPVVYLTDRLPAMTEVANVPTRPADAFEAAGLAAIRAGDDGFAGHRGNEVRFVGAIRAAETCVLCHGGERGGLLGAFSYRLRPAGP